MHKLKVFLACVPKTGHSLNTICDPLKIIQKICMKAWIVLYILFLCLTSAIRVYCSTAKV